MSSSTWHTITYQGQERNVRELTSNGEWIIAVHPQPDSPEDKVLIIHQNRVVRVEQFGSPNAADVTPGGLAVIADWLKFGEKTDSEISVIALPDGQSRSISVPYSAPLVAISPDGAAIAVSTYDECVEIYETQSLSLRSRHSILFGDRLVPGTPSSHEQAFTLRSKDDSELEYSIDFDGTVQSMTETVEQIRYIESFDIDHTTKWEVEIPELVTEYQQTDSEYIQNRIANTVGDASLAHIDQKSRLGNIIHVLADALDTFTGEEKKLVAGVLSDAHYRYARQCSKQGDISGAVDHLETAESHAKTVLPWYDGKDMLAKIYRRRARFHKQRGDNQQARQNIDRVFELEKEYDVSLSTDADERLRDELSS